MQTLQKDLRYNYNIVHANEIVKQLTGQGLLTIKVTFFFTFENEIQIYLYYHLNSKNN